VTQDEFNSVISILIASVGKAMPDAQVAAWKMLCDDLTVEELRTGVIATIRTHEFAGFPPIGLIRKNAIGRDAGLLTIDNRAAVAWGSIKRSVAERGGYQTVVFDDPLITASIRELGGWVRVCDCEPGEKFDTWLRKEFERTYTALMTAGTSAERTLPLAGLCDIANSATGHTDRVEVAEIETGLTAVPATLIRGEVPKLDDHKMLRRIAQECVVSLGIPEQEVSEPVVLRSREEQKRILQERIEVEKTTAHENICGVK
jgi:hypothetical protein